MMKTACGFVLISALSTHFCFASQPTLTATFDNDGLFGVDREYTNGLFLSYTSAELPLDNRLTSLSLSSQSLDKFEVMLGQKMYTPRDLFASEPLVNQRPYAGLLYSELNYLTILPQRTARYNVTLGVVGEDSLAAKAQRLVHNITNSEYPNGWDYQVEEGLVFNLGYLNHYALYRASSSNSTQFEISNISEINGGNLRSDISSGLMLRWGENLTGSLGAANIDSERNFRPSALGNAKQAWFLYSGIELMYRFNDITLEGNRPGIENEQNFPITLDHTQAGAVMGVAWYNHQFGASFSANIRTADYQQALSDYHANASFSVFFFL
ncbi:lipid A deacylase LpxR family protein [Vibrio rhodolitus]|uniref:lipid A deacylase LpxR family protein n=1 Tax=Vibrio rhodolitus TaxID=2231649 RepID=UPI00313426FD